MQMPSSQPPSSSAWRSASSSPPRMRSRGGRKAPTPGSTRRRDDATTSGSSVMRAGAPTRSTARLRLPRLPTPASMTTISLMRVIVPLVDGTSLERRAAAHGQRLTQRQRHRLEAGLGDVVRVAALEHVDVQRHAPAIGERLEEVAHQRHREVGRHPAPLHRVGHGQVEEAAARDVDHRARQRLVERRVRRAVARDAAAVADRGAQALAEHDADVLDGVMDVDVGVALGLDREAEPAVSRESVEHVAEEAVRHRDPDLAAVEIERRLDARLARRALELAAAEVARRAVDAARRPFRNAPPLLRPLDASRLAHRECLLQHLPRRSQRRPAADTDRGNSRRAPGSGSRRAPGSRRARARRAAAGTPPPRVSPSRATGRALTSRKLPSDGCTSKPSSESIANHCVAAARPTAGCVAPPPRCRRARRARRPRRRDSGCRAASP